MLNKGQPLRNVLLAFSLAIALPILALSSFVMWRLSEQSTRQYEQRLTQLAMDLTSDIDRVLDLLTNTLRTLAAAESLGDGNYAEFHARAHAAMTGRDLGVILLDTEGHQLANTYVPYGSQLREASNPEAIRRVARTGQPEVSNMFTGRVTGRPALNITYPVLRDGQVAHVLVLAFTPSLIRNVAAGQHLAEGWSTGVIDANFRIITRNPEHDKFVDTILPLNSPTRREDYSSQSANLVGAPVYRAVAKVHGAPWTVVATVEKRVAAQGAWNALRDLLVAGVGLLALATASAAWLGRRLARDLSQLTHASRKLGTSEVVPIQNGMVQEINVVSRALAASVERRDTLLREVSRQRNYLELVLKTVPSIIYIYDQTSRRNVYISGEAQTALGYSPDELLDMRDPLSTLIDPSYLPAITEHYRKLKDIEDGQTLAVEYRLRHKDGDWRWFLSSDRAWTRNPDGDLEQILGIAVDVTDRKRVESQVALLASIAAAAHDALIGINPDGIINAWNPGAERIFGYTAEEAIGQSARVLTWGGESEHEQTQHLQRVLRGDSIGQIETVRRRKDGSEIDVALSLAPVLTPDGEIRGVVKAAFDISPRKQWEKQQRLLARELVHRLKNSFAVLQSIVRASARGARSPEAFVEAFSGRVHSMAASFDILVAREWTYADLESLARHQLAAYMSKETDAVRIDGPSVELPPELTVPVGLALHELGTNAMKYGSLSRAGGTVNLSWTVSQEVNQRHVRIEWRERGGPPVTPPARLGFGSTLIEKGLTNCKVERRFEPSGLVCFIDLSIPLETHATP